MNREGANYETIVVGLGKTGRSAIDYLLARGQNVAAVDSRLKQEDIQDLQGQYPDLPIILGEFDPALLCRAGQLLLSPGISSMEPAIQAAITAGVRICTDVEIFCQQAKAPIIAVTGSNGKSTVVSLLTAMIEETAYIVKLGGNIGTPVLDLVDQDRVDFYVLELSSFQLETLESMNAVAAVVLNISADHMDRYTSLEDYAASKRKVYQGDGVMILNRDDPVVAAMAQSDRLSVFFSLSEPGENEFGLRSAGGETLICYGQEALLPVSSIKIRGAHNISNVLAAMALARVIKLPLSAQLKALHDFPGLPHRCQWLGRINGVDWYNDSKATNVGAACAAIEALGKDRKLVLIAGGDGKNADFSPLAEVARKYVRLVVLIGKDADLIQHSLKKNTAYVVSASMEAAVSTAAQSAEKDDVVLLSPACASKDMFDDYQQRGDKFRQAVLALPETSQ